MSVSRALRYQILRRDNHACRYCGATAPSVPLVVDHVTPITLGGTDTPDNLVTACKDCNAGKSATPPDAGAVRDIEQDAIRWTRAMQKAQQLQMSERQRLLDYMDDVDGEWREWYYPDGSPVERPENWRGSVETFYRFNVNTSDWRTAIRRAMTAQRVTHPEKWRYTCGTLWGIIRDRTEIAKRILAEEGEA